MMGKEIAMLMALAVLGYIQNLAFTWASRSRNQNNPSLHRWAALLSNSIWFVVTVLVWGQMWSALTHGSIWKILATGIVYTISTSEGSVMGMKILIKRGK
jgi:hypothetical protein